MADERAIGVLALQGAFSKHCEKLDELGVLSCEVRTKEDLEKCRGLILPGGESTVMMHLLKEKNLIESLQNFPYPIFGTCAGLILMARLNLLPITVERNAYGRQSASFQTTLPSTLGELSAIFIRAPRIRHISGSDIEILASHQEEAVFIRKGRFLAATFHPELTDDLTVHRYFVEMCL